MSKDEQNNPPSIGAFFLRIAEPWESTSDLYVVD
jgi:hypothetical protein